MSNGYQYTVVFQNNSTNAGTVALYQVPPDVPGSMPLAWLTRYAYPTTRVTLTWTLQYDFVWSQTGLLVPGVVATAAQVWPADLITTNQVTLTYDRAFTFKNQQAGPQSGSLFINADATIPVNTASVGIGMAGAPTMLVQAQPNMSYVFTPRPEYWISFGNYTTGEAIDISSMTSAAQIVFPPNIYSMTATLNANNTWTIQQTSMANAALAAARTTNAKASWTDVSS
jgi:rhizosphere induced protein